MVKSISESKRTVYATGLPLETQHHEVKALFSSFGHVRSVYLNSNNFYAFAFVGFLKEEAVDAAVNTPTPITLHGKEIHVKRRLPRSKEDELLAPPAYDEDINDLSEEEQSLETPESIKASKSCEAQTLRYGTNGELGFGTDPRNLAEAHSNRVVRADGIPIDWIADDLFKHLVGVGLPVTAVMVYDDYDERRFRQGLIQLESERVAAKLVQKGYYNTPILKLEILPSSVPSIGPVRTHYGGRFTAFNCVDNTAIQQKALLQQFNGPAKKVTGGDKAGRRLEDEHQMERMKPSMDSSNWWHKPSPNGVQGSMLHSNNRAGLPYMPNMSCHSPIKGNKPNVSHANAFSSNDWSPQTPPSAISASPEAFKRKHVGLSPLIESPDSSGGCSPQQFFPESTVLYHDQSLRDASTNYRTANSISGAFQSMVLPHKASQTVIVDNFSAGLRYDSKALAQSMAQFGQVQSADLVPMNAKYARAYVTFSSPANAELALSQLSAYIPGSERLMVRLA